jgi:aldehyde:ferredoxin oxidoreductase
MMNEPSPKGPMEGNVTDSTQLEAMKDEYYRLNGWELETGAPSKKTLGRLGLAELCG